MQKTVIKIEVAYREGKKINRAAVYEAVRDLLLTVDRHKLFNVSETEYAGYNITLEK